MVRMGFRNMTLTSLTRGTSKIMFTNGQVANVKNREGQCRHGLEIDDAKEH